MLILTRRVGETLVIQDKDGAVIAKLTVLGVKGNQVRIGTEADASIAVHREEIYDRIQTEKLQEKSKPGPDGDNYRMQSVYGE